jgi:hypothetical protein
MLSFKKKKRKKKNWVNGQPPLLPQKRRFSSRETPSCRDVVDDLGK